MARQTLDISYSQPDLIIVESPQKVIHILKEIGLDNKFTGKKFILYGISISYDLNAPRSSYDHIFVFRDETSGWVNMTIIKAMDGKVLLWIRKPTCDDFEPTPGSAYYKDWLTVTKQELSKRGIQFE